MDKKEYKKNYNNLPEQIQKRRDYMKKKREEEKLSKNKFICDCGGYYSSERSKYLHYKTNKHKLYNII